MKHMKKLIAVLLAATMAVGLAACGSTSSSTPASTSGSTSASTAASDSTSAEGLKIAIVSTAAGVDDGSFIQNCYEGILSFIDSRGGIDTVTDIMEPTGDPAAAVQAVADIVADYDVIVTPGFQFAGISTLAEENPDTKFILVDSFATDADGNTIELDNLYAMMFSEQEGGFLAGMAAALSTQTGKVASVHGIAYELSLIHI